MGAPPTPSRGFARWLDETIADSGAGCCLPTIRELSRRFDISVSSVQRRLKPYIADGTLTAIRGRGILVTSRMPGAPHPALLRTSSSADSVADAVTEDIAAGRLKHGDPLPAIKLLSVQFKATNATIIRAYRILQQRGLARKIGRNYWVGGMKSIRTFGLRKTIPCFNFSEDSLSDLTTERKIGSAYRNLELELHNHGLSLRFEECEKLDLFLRPDAFAQSDFPGIVISGIENNRFARLCPRIEALVPVLVRSGKRILVCGADPEQRVPRRTHYFCHGTIVTSVVRTAAEYAFTKGFRDIVLLFRERENNLSGIRFFLRFISESLMRNPETRIKLLLAPLDHEQSPEQILKRSPSYQYSTSFVYFEGLLSKYRQFTMHELYEMITLGDTIESLLSYAPRGALWLTLDVSTALTATQWCAVHRIAHPDGAALLCFEDAPSLHRRGIASCVPDWNTMGYLIAHALIGDIPVQTSRRGLLRTPAVLLERDTMP